MSAARAAGHPATAVAVVSFPRPSCPTETFPTAINNCMYDVFWDPTTNQPKIDPSTGQPYIFRIGSSYHYPNCDSGQWTSMFTDANDVPTVRDLIANGNPTAVSIGQTDLDPAGNEELALQRRHRPLHRASARWSRT